MKKILLCAIVSYVLTACSSKKGPTISGRFSHAANTVITLARVTENGELVLDSATTDGGGKFTMKNPVTETDYYIVRSGPQSVIYLLLSGGEDLQLTGDAHDMEHTYTVEGSEESTLIRELRRYDGQLTDSLNSAYAAARSADPYHVDSIGHLLESHYARTMQEFAATMIQKHPSALACLSATKFLNQSSDLELMKLLADSLKVKYPDNAYANDYNTLISDLQALPIGAAAPGIELNSLDGKKVSLHDFNGKLLLIDFWASWCGPCRRANPDVKRLYEKYKNQGFDILGVSLDENAAAWKQAVEKDGLTWTQVSELKKWDSKCVKDYKIEAIPFSVLIDGNGKIVAKGLSAEELDLKIRESLRK